MVKKVIEQLKQLFGKKNDIVHVEHLAEYNQYKIGDCIFRVSDVYLTIEQFKIADIRRMDNDEENVWITATLIENNKVDYDIFVGDGCQLDGQSNCWFTWYSSLDNMKSGVRSSIRYAEHHNLAENFDNQLNSLMHD